MPLVVRTERGVWCSHSIPSPETTSRFDQGVFARPLVFEDYQAPRGAAYLLVWGRGQHAEQVSGLATAWGVETFCLGHAHSDEGAHVVTPRMAVLNSDHERGRIAEFDLSAPAPSAEEIVAASVPISQI